MTTLLSFAPAVASAAFMFGSMALKSRPATAKKRKATYCEKEA